MGAATCSKGSDSKDARGWILYTGVLQKGDEKIYTAWWFDNGQHKTISQTDWRWRMGRGEASFSLINLNADRQEVLMKEMEALLKVPILK